MVSNVADGSSKMRTENWHHALFRQLRWLLTLIKAAWDEFWREEDWLDMERENMKIVHANNFVRTFDVKKRDKTVARKAYGKETTFQKWKI